MRGSAGESGPASQAEFDHPRAVAAGPDGTVYVADTGNRRVRRIDPDGHITTVAGQPWGGAPAQGCLAVRADIGRPTGIALDPTGTLYIADPDHHQVWRLAADGHLHAVIAGPLPAAPAPTTPTADPPWTNPTSLAADARGALYLTDPIRHRVWRIHDGHFVTLGTAHRT
ncbi:SMP-30/gluconolactonase/LRE family protein [Frankia sp. Ag45/Mut15]|uniref:SMP-30/gluconolactonase/LRE family protein n=1 Tax=Frankia umida TaxID=573489 RepID=A0ABT0K3J9_9ACTN|nr:SMP-30/gluconolactonase/LRE family protein [Frankia umida]MCK9877863.1 SMP-30/gluconolactonase/LRE family protein [Frankia umida]